MYSLLLENNIIAEKKSGKEGKASLLVEESHIPKAIEILRQRGYPRGQFQSLNDIFTGDSLIPSPQEQAAKLNYVRSQELAQVLSDIDGVITARVLFTRPEFKADSDTPPEHSVSAAIFIKYSPDIPVFRYRDQIKHLVKNSIQGLTAENISLTLIPAITAKPVITTPELRTLMNIQVTTGSYTKLLSYAAGFIILFISSHLLHFFLNKRKPRHERPD